MTSWSKSTLAKLSKLLILLISSGKHCPNTSAYTHFLFIFLNKKLAFVHIGDALLSEIDLSWVWWVTACSSWVEW
jgi:D-arabinose 5-phosphate isomerase GutQ